MAALTGELAFQAAKPGLIRALAEERTDPVLFAWSHDYVGDLAETVALIWPGRPSNQPTPTITDVVQTLISTPKSELPFIVAGWLDASDASVRFALLKLITGGLRVGVSARIAKIALAELADNTIAADDIEEVWHGLAPPYQPLFAWLEGRAERPDPRGAPVFRPPMLAVPLEAPDFAAIDPAAHAAEWKWDGIRVQLVATSRGRRIYSRGADDVSAAFPEILDAMGFEAVLDGELLVKRGADIAPFADLQQRHQPQGARCQDAAGLSAACAAVRHPFRWRRGPSAAAVPRAPGPAGGLDCPAQAAVDGPFGADPVSPPWTSWPPSAKAPVPPASRG